MVSFIRLKTPTRQSWWVAFGFLCSWTLPVAAQVPTPSLPAVPQPAASTFSLQPPQRNQVFRVESDRDLLKRIRLETDLAGKKEEYPIETVYPSKVQPRPFGGLPTSVAQRVPYLVCYHPLYFQEKNSERYGLGIQPLQPVVSTGIFYLNTILLPVHLVGQPPWTWECNSGYFLPGDRVPYKLYLWP